MHVRVRVIGKPDTVVVVESKLTKIEQFRKIINDKFGVQPKLQRLLYGGKFLENGYTFHDYNIKLNDVIQLMVKAQPDEESEPKKKEIKKSKDIVESKEDAEKTEYRDAESTLYAVGDFVDMRDKEQGAWFEGKIVRIVFDPQIQHVHIVNENSENEESEPSSDKENDSESNHVSEKSNQSKQRGIAKYFSISPRPVKKKCMENVRNENTGKINDANLLYQIQLDADEENSNLYAKLKDIRPRARKEIAVSGLKIGQKVMINHNTEEPLEKGYWYDFKIDEIKKQRTAYELVGTLFLGPEAVPQNDTKVKIHDKIYEIEEVVPLKNRSEEYKKMMVTQPEKRALPLNCLTCRDDEDTGCKDCGCYLCSGKEFPEKIILCDECNRGYHMGCLSPPLTDVPADDWYCPACKRDPHEVIAPGAAKQVKKTNASKTNRDWGRGMACVGKTKECLMPPNHFGPIPGIEVGMCWRFRIQLSESGVHRPPVSGIHGRDTEGAYSIVLSGGYEDDVDHGNEFTYTGSGGRDLSGNKRTAEQSCDQTLTRENRALARNCAAKHPISEGGGDAGAAWREGRPVRVVRSYKMLKHFPKYAPKEGIRYDGIYKVVKYYPEQGLSGFRVWKYLLRRDDPAPAPWEPHAKVFPIIYPDGYLEAEAEKMALKEKNNQAKTATKNKKNIRQYNKKKDVRQTKKRIHDDVVEDDESSDETSSGDAEVNGGSKPKDNAPPAKKKKIDCEVKKSISGSDSKLFNNEQGFNGTTEPRQEGEGKREVDPIEDQIKEFTSNCKLWDECLEVLRSRGKKEFTDQVAQVFMCNICQGLAVDPVTTPCQHNFCLACLRNASKNVVAVSCPCCRGPVPATDAAAINEPLQKALRIIFPGYDSRK